MDRKALLISIAATLGGVGLLQLYMHRFEQLATGGPATPVLVLAKDVPAGTAITRDMLGSRGLPQSYLDSRHIPARAIDQVLDARLAVAGRSNEALLWSDLASMREPARQLSSLVPEGMRAITLEVRGSGFDALLAPGDRVDVLLVAGKNFAGPADSGTTIVAQNLLVLAVGDDLGGPDLPSEQRGRRGGRITLSVALREGARLAQAEQQGTLRLVLRNPDDLAVSDMADTRALTNSRPGGTAAVRGED
jgi:pilus assembly protein CpaB